MVRPLVSGILPPVQGKNVAWPKTELTNPTLGTSDDLGLLLVRTHTFDQGDRERAISFHQTSIQGFFNGLRLKKKIERKIMGGEQAWSKREKNEACCLGGDRGR